MTPPNDIPVYELKLCTLWMDKDGILNTISKPVERNLANSKEQLEFIQKISNGEKMCLLSDVSKSSFFDMESRRYLKQELKNFYKALALVTNSAMGRMIGNIVLGFINPGIPTRLFTDEVQAHRWLMQFKQEVTPVPQ